MPQWLCCGITFNNAYETQTNSSLSNKSTNRI